MGLCVDKSNVVGIWAIKKPHTARIQKLEKYAKVSLSAMWEYGYIYVQAKYRWRWITKKLYTLLLKKIHIPLYVTVKQNNIPMKKLLQQFWFVTVWNSFKSSLDWKLLDIYIQK